MLRKTLFSTLLAGTLLASSGSAFAATEIEFWHAFTGRLGDLVADR